MQKVFIVIPAYNEQKTISKVIKDLKKEGYKNIVVVDDGSKDNTYEEAKKQNVEVLRHIINRGQGAALKTAIDYALDLGADSIITFDADGQHSVKDIEKMIRPLKKNKVDITLGSRFLKKDSNTPFVRKLFLKGGAIVIFLMYGIKLTDSHNGLRALSRKAAEKIEITSDGMEHASEILEQVKKKRLKYKEVPVTITYTDYSLKTGQSTFNSFRILFKMIIRWLTR
jgi:glycosyltransferase involved in cell wall biosynthesis